MDQKITHPEMEPTTVRSSDKEHESYAECYSQSYDKQQKGVER
jgi:hypothetical protein